MPYILRFSQTTSAREVIASLKRTLDTSYALVFPSSLVCRMASEREMDTLSAYCAKVALDITIIGGDAELRARAVAARFAAATSLDDWGALDDSDEYVPGGRLRDFEPFTVVPDDVEDDPQGLYDPLRNDPPAFVRRLQASHSSVQREDTAHVTRLFPSIAQHVSEQEQAEALQRACERYEERIAARIRRTSGLSAASQRRPAAVTRPLGREAQASDSGLW